MLVILALLISTSNAIDPIKGSMSPWATAVYASQSKPYISWGSSIAN